MKTRILSIGLACTALVGLAPGQTLSRASIDSHGRQGTSASGYYDDVQSLGLDCVAFETTAANLVPSLAASGGWQICVHDLRTHQVRTGSVNTQGVPANADASYPALSADDHILAFSSTASNLVTGATNGVEQVYLHSFETGATQLVSCSSAGTPGNAGSSMPSISADGRRIAFSSSASNLVAGDTNNSADAFVRDLTTGVTTRIGITSGFGIWGVQLSADGKTVAFVDEGFAATSVYVRSLVSGQTTLVSTNAAPISLSGDGRFAAYVHWSPSFQTNVYVKDLLLGTVTIASVSSTGAPGNGSSYFYGGRTISGDGRFVTFYSDASNLCTGDTNACTDVFVHDLLTGQTQRISTRVGGLQGNAPSQAATISVDGGRIAFSSDASNLVAGDNNATQDVFVYTWPLTGVDVSKYAGDVNPGQWGAMHLTGVSCAVVQAWGGRTQNPYALAQLRNARTSGLRTAAYCLLNFDDGAPSGPQVQSGGWQVDQALDATGEEADHLSFLAIDVETAFPLVLNTASRLTRISEAVTEAQAAGLAVVIYTSRNDWSSITGNSTSYSQAGYPLWDAVGDQIPSLARDYSHAWVPYAGWTERKGKQYILDTRLFGVPVDMNVFDFRLFPFNPGY